MADVRITAATIEEEEQVAELIVRALAAYPVPVAVDTPRRLPNRYGTAAYRIVLSVIPGTPPSPADPAAQHTVQVEREDTPPSRARGERRGGRSAAGHRSRRALPPGTSG